MVITPLSNVCTGTFGKMTEEGESGEQTGIREDGEGKTPRPLDPNNPKSCLQIKLGNVITAAERETFRVRGIPRETPIDYNLRKKNNRK